MEPIKSRYTGIQILISLACLFILSSCGSTKNTGPAVVVSSSGASSANSITVSASSSAISKSGTSTISATVLDASSVAVSDGTTVTFSVSSSALGSITTSATTTSGVATATFTASTTSGTVTITATVGSLSATTTVSINAANSVTVAATPSTVSVGGTSSISATVLDSSSAAVTTGTSVVFSLSDSSLGTITSPGSTNASGVASSTFTASSTNSGTVTVTATVGTISGTTTVTVSPASAGSIQYTSATPALIAVKGGGGTETSTITFTVKNTNGGNVADGTQVDFCLLGPKGGEYLNTDDATTEAYTDANSNGCFDTGETYTDSDSDGEYDSPLHAVGSTVSGVATVTLASGSVPGNAIITATVQSTAIATSSSTISIGGGAPNEAHLSLVTSAFNIPGLAYHGETATLTVYIADRFGNANVLQGTAVNFVTESGATLLSTSYLDATGSTTATFRTGSPAPNDVNSEAWEDTLIARMNTDYGITVTKNPRDGWATIIATITGEESFNDVNANGSYDLGTDTFTDSPSEAYLDINDDGAYNLGPYVAATVDTTPNDGTDPFELFIDSDSDGVHDGVDGTWDSSKVLYEEIILTISGLPIYIKMEYAGNNNSTIALADSGNDSLVVMVADENLNAISPGSTIVTTETCTTAALSGSTSYTVGDGLSTGPTEIGLYLKDTDAANVLAENCSITVTVTHSKGGVYSATFSGTVN